MFLRFRPRLKHASVVAYLALFVALAAVQASLRSGDFEAAGECVKIATASLTLWRRRTLVGEGNRDEACSRDRRTTARRAARWPPARPVASRAPTSRGVRSPRTCAARAASPGGSRARSRTGRGAHHPRSRRRATCDRAAAAAPDPRCAPPRCPTELASSRRTSRSRRRSTRARP